MTQFNTRIQPSISISAPDSVNLDIVQGMGDDTFYQASGKLVVATNNASGYRILVSSASNTSSLVSVDNASDAVISSIPTARQAGEFGDNTWGYYISSVGSNLDSTVYQPMSVTTTEALKVNTASSTATYDLGFGTRLDASLPAGTYSNSILISAVANPLEIHSLLDLTFMQDMTSSICSETPSAYNEATGKSDTSSPYYLEPVTKQLYDIRDGNMYWVAKLADGNCWMTQNLALDLSTERTLTPGDTDVTSEWIPSASTEIGVPPIDKTNTDKTRSWNLGKILLAKPTNSTACPNQTPPEGYTGPTTSVSAFPGQNLADACSTNYIDVDTASLKPSSEPIATATTSIVGNEYDSHYLIGNYYQFGAITAGSGVGLAGNTEGRTDASRLVDAPDSICPRGWMLPKTGNLRKDDGNGGPMFAIPDSYYELFNKYGYTADKTWFYLTNGNTGVNMLNNPALNEYNIAGAPLYYAKAGLIDPGAGNVRFAGNTGNYMSSTVSPEASSSSIYTLYIETTSFYMSATNSRNLGYFARCLAR